MNETSKLKMPSPRFGLAALLLVIACLAAIFAGFRIGYKRGYASGQEQWRAEQVEPVVYNVGDLLDAQHDLGHLQDAIVATVGTESWSNVGGPGEIQPVGSDQLLISQTPPNHEIIHEVLESIRNGRHKK
jgi:hypothetical protein